MKNIFNLLILIICSSSIIGQTKTENDSNESISTTSKGNRLRAKCRI
jgi:hypothetical protein